MKKIDWKKARSLALTYASLTLPIATAAYAMNATTAVKVLSFLSGTLAVIAREMNPKDPFTINLLKVAQVEVDAELAKAKATPKKKAQPKA